MNVPEWLTERFAHWTITTDGENLRGEREGCPVKIAGNATDLGALLAGIDAWELRDLIRLNCTA